MTNQVDIHALWAFYRCDYVLSSAERNELWNALSKQAFLSTTEKEMCDLIEAYVGGAR